MNDIFAALLAAARDLFRGRMLGLVFKPVLGATLFWGVVAWLGWGHWLLMFQHFYGAVGLAHVDNSSAAVGWLGGALAFLVLGAALVVLVLVTALLITSLFAMPAIVDEVARRHYPALARLRGGSNTGSLLNAGWALLVFLLLIVLTLPLWFIVPLGGWLLPLLINGWLNARLFRYDALAEHASRDEYRALCKADGGTMLLMGVILAALQLVPSATVLLLPLVILLLPVYTALAYVHFALARLQARRAAAGDSQNPILKID